MGKASNIIITIITIIITVMFGIDMNVISNKILGTVGIMIISIIGIILILINTLNHKKCNYIFNILIGYSICAIISIIVNIYVGYTITQTIMTILTITFWIIIFFIGYVISKENAISLKPLYILFLSLPFIAYYFNHILINQLINKNESVNNIYYMLLFLPIVLSIPRKVFKLLGIILIFSGVIVSLKRTAVLALGLSVIIYAVVSFIIENNNGKKIITLLALSFVVIILTTIIYNYLINIFNIDWGIRIKSLQTDGGSGRDIIWRTILIMQSKSNLGEWLFGHGYNAVFNLTPFRLSAHNDFLEILFDYGIITLVFYIYFIFSLIKVFFEMCKRKYFLAPSFSASLVIFFTMSLTSHLVIYPTYFIYLSLYWGITIGQYENGLIFNSSELDASVRV